MYLDFVLHLILIIVGLPVLANGGRFIWLFAGLGGILAVLSLTAKNVTLDRVRDPVVVLGLGLVDWSSTMVAAVALVAGIAMGALVLVARRLAAAPASFAGVGFVCMNLAILLGMEQPWATVFYVVAGTVAAAAVFIRLDWGIIIASSLTGAGVVALGILFLTAIVGFWGGWTPALLTAILTTVGIIKQARDLQVSDGHTI